MDLYYLTGVHYLLKNMFMKLKIKCSFSKERKKEKTSLIHGSYQRTREKLLCLIRGLHYLQEYFQNV